MAKIPADLTHYEILGVANTASFADIRGAYLRLVKIYHPDLARPSRKKASIQIFQLITAAYAVLGKPDTRQAYDIDLASQYRPAEPINDNGGGLWEKLFK